VILLDDGFQHRYVQPSLSILLVDSNRPVFEDKLLPAGSLREPLKGKDRASMVIVTKCNPDMQPIDFRIYTNGLNLFPYQDLFFTSLQYGMARPLFPELQEEQYVLDDLRKKHVFLVTGIASPQPLADKLAHKTYNLYTRFFPDHHTFTKEDVEEIRELMASVDVDEDEKIILTTEKDAMRLRGLTFLDEDIKRILYYVPIRIAFVEESDKELFNKKILAHVRNHQKNSRLH
jgi:tetraacyldisaccharide 4'-kinase